MLIPDIFGPWQLKGFGRDCHCVDEGKGPDLFQLLQAKRADRDDDVRRFRQHPFRPVIVAKRQFPHRAITRVPQPAHDFEVGLQLGASDHDHTARLGCDSRNGNSDHEHSDEQRDRTNRMGEL